MERSGTHQSTPKFTHRDYPNASAIEAAEALATAWQAADDALSPIIGKRGVAALYKRSLRVTATSHPWLSSLISDHLGAIDITALSTAFAQQTAASAAAASDALLQAFSNLLASLLGATLTNRLLEPVWSHFPSGTPAQDPTP